MAARPLPTSLDVGATRVHLFQAIREHRDGGHEDWVVVGFAGDSIDLASLDFEWHRSVPASAVADGTVEPLVEGGVPVWAY